MRTGRTLAAIALVAGLLAACGQHSSSGSSTLVDRRAADPVRIRIPAIGVDAPIGALEVDATGALPPPPSNEAAGWWRDGPEPGERGAAVIAGHVDSHTGPAVFYRLARLDPGDEIVVDRADGTSAVFAAQSVERYAKDSFPTTAVYGPAPRAELRLVTCGGKFDRKHRRYRDNVVVYATRTG